MIRFAMTAAFVLLAPVARADVAIQEITSPGGIGVWLVEERTLPFVALEIHFEGGASLDDPAKRGAANLMTALIEEGSGDMDARTFQAAREALAASFSFDVYDDGMTVSATFLTENADAAVALLQQALTQPRFDEDAIERVRAQVLSNIASEAKRPNSIAGAVFDAGAFGDHPYGSSESGTVESVNALGRDDLIASHAALLVRDRAAVSAVGDISAEALGAIVDALLAGLPETGPALPSRVEFALTGGIEVVDFDTPQSVALFGHAGIERDDPDFFAAYILNTILGGTGPQSILMEEVREKRGLTYGIYTYLVPKDQTEMVLGTVASANDRMAETVEVVRTEWARIAAEGVTQAQLDAAKTFLTGEYPLRFDGNEEIAGIMVGMQVTDLTPAYVVDRNDFINAVTLADVNRVAAYLLQPDALHFTIVGRPEGVVTGPLPGQ